MKKRAGKLKLYRETLRHLAEPRLGKVAGGTAVETTDWCRQGSWCACPSEDYCGTPPTLDHTCNTVCWTGSHTQTDDC